jgi:predicted enzyme related to lactoylglutathione lyase
MNTNRTFITEEVWVPAFMEQDGIRDFPVGGGMTTKPKNNKKTSKRLFEGWWHDADQFIRNVIGTGGFVVAEATEGAVESM